MSITPKNENQSPATESSIGKVVVLSGDLFFGMRIRTVLRQLGYAVRLIKDIPTFELEAPTAILGLIDFNQPIAWQELAPTLAAGLPVIGFGSHTDVDGFRAARAAGIARVVSNGEFNRSLPQLAKKYAREA